MPIDPFQALSQFTGNMPTFIAVILAWINSNARIGDNQREIHQLRSETKDAIKELTSAIKDLRLEMKDDAKQMHQDTRDTLRAEFRRVEEVMDARLKHLEEREG